MKVIELEQNPKSFDDLIGIADMEPLIFKTTNGKFFVLAPVDEFEAEVESLQNNPEFMAFMHRLSKEEPVISLEDLRTELGV